MEQILTIPTHHPRLSATMFGMDYKTDKKRGWEAIPISSSTAPETYYTVLFPPWGDESPICECRGYRFKGKCKHQPQATKELENMAKIASKKSSNPAPYTSHKDVLESLEDSSLESRLDVLASGVVQSYALWKEHEAEKDEFKSSLFDAIDDFIEENVPLERTTERVVLKAGEDIDEALATRYPLLRVAIDSDGTPLMEQNPEDENDWIAVLEEDPRYMKFSHVLKDEEMVVSRGRTERGAGFDLAGFISEHPDLAKRCVVYNYSFSLPFGADPEKSIESGAANIISTPSLDEALAEALINEDATRLAIFSQFRVAGKPSMTLPKPRKAKKGELA